LPAPATRIAIVGGGFGGLAAARCLERQCSPEHVTLTLLNETNYMTYTPFLPQAAAGTLEPRHVVVPLRQALHRTSVRVGHVLGADYAARTVRFRSDAGEEGDVSYDQLILAPGSSPRTAPIPGLTEAAIGFATLAEAIWLRNHVLRQLEIADATANPSERRRRLTVAFVGGGYAGVEALAEIEDLTRVAKRLYPSLRAERLRWLLIEATDAIFPEVGPRLAAYAMRELVARGVELRLGTTVTEASRNAITLSTGDRIPCATLVWTAGVRPAPIVRRLELPLDARGRIRVDATMAVEGRDGVWALGDAAAVPDPARPGLACPPTSQHAVRQGRVVARNVLRTLEGQPAEPFRYRTIGLFVDLGRGKAVASVFGLQFKGFPAWFLGRTYHLSQVPGIRRKGRIAADWAVGLIFRRDTAELGTLGHPEGLER
jgi:NADH dehydrogenase